MIMSVQIVDNFKLLKPMPLDSRVVVNFLGDIPNYARYEGMIVYQVSNGVFYKYKNAAFSPFEAAGGGGVASVNDAIGDIVLVGGSNVQIVETSPGTFEFQLDGVLLNDGSSQMISGYIPTDPLDLITKGFLETTFVENLIDDDSIKQDGGSHKIYVAKTDGGNF
jgi:hypothetical protein